MIRYTARTLAGHLRAGGVLYLLTVFGAALGVASVLSIQVINRNAIAAFAASVQAVSGDADLTILGRTPAFPERLYREVLGQAGVAAAWPLYRVDVAVAGADAVFLQVIGVDLLASSRLPWATGPPSGDRLAEALGRPGWAAVTPALASRNGWRIGDGVEVTSGSRRVRLVVGALVDFQRRSPTASPKLVVMDIAQAQALFGRPGELHQIDVRAVPNRDLAGLARQLGARLGPAVQVLTPGEREARVGDLLGAFRLNLTALSLISLLVGLFLVHESTQAALVRRRAELGLLRALGATRRQVLGLILVEVVVLGLAGVALGLPLGYWVARANVGSVSRTLTNLYLLEEIQALELPLWLAGLAAVIGIGGAVGGALLPALDLARRPPTALLAALTLHAEARAVARPLFAAGWAILALAGLWYLAAGRDWQPAGFVLGVALLLAIPLVTPYVVDRVAGRIRVRRFGLAFSVRSLATRLQTTAFAVASLAIAVSMLVGITIMVGSFRRTLEAWVDTTVRADVYVTTPTGRRGGSDATLDPRLVATLAQHPGVAYADRVRRFTGYAGERRITVVGVDMAIPDRERRFALVGTDAAAAFRRVRQEGAVLVSEPLARKARLGPGDWLPIAAPAGELRLPVAGVYADYSSESGAVVMDLDTMAARFGPGGIHSLGLYLEPGRDAERVMDELRSEVGDAPLLFRDNRRLRREIFAIFDQTFAVTRVLQAMSLLIAVSGITLTLLVLARERVSELALYRSLGATRPQIFRVFVGHGVGMAMLALGLGLTGGVVLAAILVFVINRAYFGWTIQLHWPAAAIVEQAVTIVAAAIVASLYPAARASRTPATELSRDT